jgi:hypothetical protein
MTAVAEHINRPEWAQFHRHHNLICQRCWFKQAEIGFAVSIPGEEEW